MRFHAKDLRKGRYSESGRIYYVTTTTYQRRKIFADLTIARQVVRALHQEDESNQVVTLAYVLMPDHLHWLLQLKEAGLSAVVGRIKSVSAHQIGEKVWQSGFYDHAVRREEDIIGLARYIIANPLRAGLVERVEEYPHWDAVWL